MYNTRIDIEPSTRKTVIALLQPALRDAVDLFTQIKQAHWNVKGPNFIALHELFDDIAEQVEEHGDLIAERITALGGRADGTARIVAAASRLDEYPLDVATGAEHIAAVAERLAAFAQTVRVAIDTAADLGDADTADLFTEVSRETDKQLWLVEAHLQADG
jgi:starvation-inducible DNA-binding protein